MWALTLSLRNSLLNDSTANQNGAETNDKMQDWFTQES